MKAIGNKILVKEIREEVKEGLTEFEKLKNETFKPSRNYIVGEVFSVGADEGLVHEGDIVAFQGGVSFESGLFRIVEDDILFVN